MSSSKWTVTLIVAVLIFAAYSYVAPKFMDIGPVKPPIADQNPPFNLHPEVDKTDTYAIPLDSSELEQEQDLEELEEGYPDKQRQPQADPKLQLRK